ncbi:DUF6090 family protein [Ichthyenterobacterium sp. W332]|uniref:DUF6090 family protein n=1 Tax=Microcosmobacter mediterraneus TaxID=3075607 RepID=A0ABU2YKA2_9FLAO|nr:DUF6090 family protein [Ichthyenterobacterium sp. W332]MDT0558255.1 DUF6090 family protein [Ichthyenterobacterium sp. W332]
MIKFFRHIRKNLLMENKTSKYFKYAIGEIILVMIGILLALQVNNWNEKRKESLEYQKFIIKLKSNLQDDINLYNQAIDDNTNHLKHLDTSLMILKNHKTYTTKDLQPHLAYIQYLSRFNSNNTAYINLQSTGKLNIVTNDSLSDKLILYYRDITLQEKSITAGIDAYNRNTFGPLLLEFDFKNPSSEFGYKPLIAYAKNPKIVNSIELKSIMLNLIIRRYTEQIENAESIIKLIHSEIKHD